MMASYRLFAVFVVLCTVHAVHSYSITGTVKHKDGAVNKVKVSNYIEGENWGYAVDLTLDRSADADPMPALTLANFKSLHSLTVTNIALIHVPVFLNTTCGQIYIKNNRIKSVPANAFSRPNPYRLGLSNNEIQTMADRSVNVGASFVDLSCNKLTHFSSSWFEDPASIDILNLESNRIEHIQDGAFNQMTQLALLQLGYNGITSIGTEAFGSGLYSLELQFNNIAQLTLDMFAHGDKPVKHLLLHHNQLSYLPEALLLTLQPSQITLFGNPWQCQCLRDIERLLRELNSTRLDILVRRGKPVCVVPGNFAHVCIPVVDTELQQTYARGQSRVQGCWARPCQCKPYDVGFHGLT